MGLFKPEIGLVFWMLVVFLIILAILAKYAWPVIIRSIEQRADFIDSGVKFTREAKQRQVSRLSLEIAEKVLRKDLSKDTAQVELVDRMLDELESAQKL